ncbi:hypothetical protein [Methylobacter sp. S3L5C]|uniref:hypothetical protein n=1 Tax=Methylobacter sp. S3L5C TaxID=2839024 RepID=UPI001FAD2B80|nr:hypothetical protein [Methylobacter sp. S3L5C]UOA07086.1 hypothetical protein KKZ03_12240 [Methylobacter sp. S3L5C]
MNKPKLLTIFFIISVLNSVTTIASEHHSGHGGGNKSGGGSGGSSCEKARVGKFLPPQLATVAPEGEFSFLAFNVDRPNQIHVTVKNIPVEVTAELKEPYYLIKGKIPNTLFNTVARINIKIDAKSSHCEAEDGWLLTIADK